MVITILIAAGSLLAGLLAGFFAGAGMSGIDMQRQAAKLGHAEYIMDSSGRAVWRWKAKCSE